MSKKSNFLLFLILVITILVYANSFSNQFIWDDFHLVTNDPAVRSFRNLPLVFKTHLFGVSGSSNFYRPVQTLSFMVDYHFWQLKPFGYHLTNLIFHMAAVLMVFLVMARIFRNPDIGLLASFMFAIHPINTEAVTYIAGRADPMSAFFFLLSVYAYMKFRDLQKRRLVLVSLISFALALLTKEAVLVLPLVIILYDALILKEKALTRANIRNYMPYIILLLAYVFLRLFVLGVPLGFKERPLLSLFMINTPKVIVEYIGLLFMPINLHMERLEPVATSILNWQVSVSILVMVCITWLAAVFYRRWKELFFCLIFFFLTILPVMNILTINALMAEHWLYLPAVGMYGIFAFGILKVVDPGENILGLKLRSKLLTLVIAAAFVAFSAMTITRNAEWGDPFAFYKKLTVQSPYSAKAHLNLGTVYLERRQFDLAREEFKTGIYSDPSNPYGHYIMGYLDMVENRKRDALKNWRRALEKAPFYKPAENAVFAYLHMENKRFIRLNRALKGSPGNIMVNYRLSKVYMQNGLYLNALERLDTVLEINPKYTDAIFNRAWIYSKLEIYSKALQEYEYVMKLTPDDPDIYNNMGYCYACLNRRPEAQRAWHKARQLKRQLASKRGT